MKEQRVRSSDGIASDLLHLKMSLLDFANWHVCFFLSLEIKLQNKLGISITDLEDKENDQPTGKPRELKLITVGYNRLSVILMAINDLEFNTTSRIYTASHI